MQPLFLQPQVRLTHATSVCLCSPQPVSLMQLLSVCLCGPQSVSLMQPVCVSLCLRLSVALIPSHSHATSLCLWPSLCLSVSLCLLPSFRLILIQPLFVSLSLWPLFSFSCKLSLSLSLSVCGPHSVSFSCNLSLSLSLSLSVALILSHSHATSLCLSVSGSVSLHLSCPLSHSQIIVPLHIFTHGKVTRHPLMTDELASQCLHILHTCHTMLVLKTTIKRLASTQLEAQVPAHHPVYPACLSEQGRWTKGKRSTRLLSPEES